MAVRKLIVFKHESELGNAPAYKLFDTIKVAKKPDVIAPRSFEDYNIQIAINQLPNGVSCTEMI